MRAILILLVSIFCISSLYAKQGSAYDSSQVQVRQIPEKTIQSYQKDTDFDYDRQIPKEESLWDRFWEWVWYRYDELMHTKYGPLTRNIIFILIGAGVLFFIIYHILRGNTSTIFQKSREENNHFLIETEDLHQIHYDEAIRDALKNGDYNLCIRLLYLKSLKVLSDKQLIEFNINKTNTTYLLELPGNELRKPFAALTRKFENVYYGNMQVNKNEVDEMQEKFNQLLTQI